MTVILCVVPMVERPGIFRVLIDQSFRPFVVIVDPGKGRAVQHSPAVSKNAAVVVAGAAIRATFLGGGQVGFVRIGVHASGAFYAGVNRWMRRDRTDRYSLIWPC